MTQTLNSTAMEYKTHLPNLTDFEKVKNINNKNYVKFISNSIIEIKINEKEEDKSKNDERSPDRQQDFVQSDVAGLHQPPLRDFFARAGLASSGGRSGAFISQFSTSTWPWLATPASGLHVICANR